MPISKDNVVNLFDAVVNLEPIDHRELSLDEALEALRGGKVIVLEGYEATRNKDVLVRLDDRKYPVTQISFEVAPIDSGFDKRHWQIFDVPFNALVLKKVFLYNEDYYGLTNKYSLDDVVKYTSSIEDVEDVGLVTGIYRDKEDSSFWYTLSREDVYYKEEELAPIK